MNLNGKLIVIEGTEGSGKQTQTAKLKERLEAENVNVYSRSFPNYESQSSALVKMYLAGEIKKTANEVKAEAASIFYAADRYITYKTEFEEIFEAKDSLLLFDRYINSNIIHQGVKKLMELGAVDEKEKEKVLEEFITWLDDLEHIKLGLPKEDLCVFLYVPVDYTIKMRETRANKITGGEKQDIHEADVAYLKAATETGLMAAKLLNWKIINCVENDKLRSIEDISDEIYETIKKI